jgi:hypothetical protein
LQPLIALAPSLAIKAKLGVSSGAQSKMFEWSGKESPYKNHCGELSRKVSTPFGWKISLVRTV